MAMLLKERKYIYLFANGAYDIKKGKWKRHKDEYLASDMHAREA